MAKPINNIKLKEYIKENYYNDLLIQFLFEGAETTACILHELTEKNLTSRYENKKYILKIEIDEK